MKTKTFRGLIALSIICFCFVSSSIYGVNGQLFTDPHFDVASDAEKEVLDRNIINEESQQHLVRNRYVEINMESLANDSFLELNLFDDLVLSVEITKKVVRSDGDFSLFGNVVGEKYSSINFVVKENRVFGNINYRHYKFQIRWMGGDTHSISEINRQMIPPGAPSVSPKNDTSMVSPSGSFEPAASTDDGSSVDVFVVYTQAAAASGNINSEIQLAVDYMNQALVNTDVALTISLVGTAMVDYYETGIALTDLNRLSQEGDGFMDEVFYFRDAYGADLVALVTESMNRWAGLGYVNSSTPNESAAFHVSVRPYLTETFAHEVGHNFGMTHELYQSPTGGAYSYSHGYVDLTNRFSTIMAYGSECWANGYYCTAIQYYSTPLGSVLYNGHAVGTASADNRLTILNTKLAISQFRQSKTSSQLSDLDAAKKGCFIATAAYGSFLDPHVYKLRQFRDRYLEPYAWGRALMKFYYANSPPLADLISQHESLRFITRIILLPVVFAVTSPLLTMLILMFAGFVFYSRKQHVRRMVK